MKFHRHYPQGFIQDVLLEGGNNQSYANHTVPLDVCDMLPQEFVFNLGLLRLVTENQKACS